MLRKANRNSKNLLPFSSPRWCFQRSAVSQMVSTANTTAAECGTNKPKEFLGLWAHLGCVHLSPSAPAKPNNMCHVPGICGCYLLRANCNHSASVPAGELLGSLGTLIKAFHGKPSPEGTAIVTLSHPNRCCDRV